MSKIFLLFSIGVIITLQANYQYLPRDIKQVIFHEVIKSCLTTENYKQILCLKLIDKESSLIFSDFMRNFSDRSIKAKNDLSLIALSSNEQIQILMNNESQATCLLSWLGDFISNKLSQYKDEQKIVIDFQLVCCHRLLKQISTLPGAEQLLMSAHNAVYSVYQAVLFTAICVQDYGYIDQLLNKNIAINHKIFNYLITAVKTENLEIVKLLVIKGKADLDNYALDDGGKTALIYAREAGYTEIENWLISQGATNLTFSAF